jgi:hypothetical protein
MYTIVRFYKDHPTLRRRVIQRGLTLEQAQAHCKDPETSSSTAKGSWARRRTRLYGAWFDGYEEAR